MAKKRKTRRNPRELNLNASRMARYRTPEEHRRITAALSREVAAELEQGLNRAQFFSVLRQLGYSSYREYLDSPLWASIRGRVLKGSGGRCDDCTRRASQVHHGRSLEWLLSVCDRCHGMRHGKGT